MLKIIQGFDRIITFKGQMNKNQKIMKQMKSTFCLVALFSLITTSAVQAQSHSIGKGYVDMLVKPYLEIQQGLAGDDLSSAQSGAKSLLNMTGHGHFSGNAKAEVEELKGPVVAILNASTISAAREEFQDLSHRLTALIKRVGTSGGTNLYLAKCPMAFGGQGGTWIQDNEKRKCYVTGREVHELKAIRESQMDLFDSKEVK